jgi:hypothetical protein
VSVTAPASVDAGIPQQAIPSQEVCPLCRAALQPEQDWCLRCGTGARTRLAAPPKWKALAVTLVLVVILALGVLAVALVKLAG